MTLVQRDFVTVTTTSPRHGHPVTSPALTLGGRSAAVIFRLPSPVPNKSQMHLTIPAKAGPAEIAVCK